MAARAIAYAAEFDNPTLRAAPKAGYNTEAKAKYRSDVWRHLANARDLIHSPTDKVLIMPSREGLEIDVALSHGIPRESLLCVDRSAAIIATSVWRKVHPDIAFMACDAGEAPERAMKRGWRIVAANLDLCGNFSEAMVQTVRRFWRGVRGQEDFILGLTVAKGREGSAISYLLNAAAKTDGLDNRVAAILSAAEVYSPGIKMNMIGQGQYKSGAQPMAWAVLALDNFTARESRLRAIHDDIIGYVKRQDFKGFIAKYGRTHPMPCPGFEWGERTERFLAAAADWSCGPDQRDFYYSFEVADLGLGDVDCTPSAVATLLFHLTGDAHATKISKERLRRVRQYQIPFMHRTGQLYSGDKSLRVTCRTWWKTV